MLKIDGFDDCVIGYVHPCGREPMLVYDEELILARLMEDGTSREDAQEYIDFNITGAYMGPGTPLVLIRSDLETAVDACS